MRNKDVEAGEAGENWLQQANKLCVVCMGCVLAVVSVPHHN